MIHTGSWSVVVITIAKHAKGPRFKTEQEHDLPVYFSGPHENYILPTDVKHGTNKITNK